MSRPDVDIPEKWYLKWTDFQQNNSFASGIGCVASSFPAAVATSQTKVTIIKAKDANEMTEPRLCRKMFINFIIALC